MEKKTDSKKTVQQINQEKARRAIQVLQEFQNTPYKSARTIAYLKKVSPNVFREIVLICLQQQGYHVQRHCGYRGMEGYNAIIRTQNNYYTILVRAERYKDDIPKRHIEGFLSKVQSRRVSGWFIHTGKTKKESWEFVKGKPIRIISGERLVELIAKHEESQSTQQTNSEKEMHIEN